MWDLYWMGELCYTAFHGHEVLLLKVFSAPMAILFLKTMAKQLWFLMDTRPSPPKTWLTSAVQKGKKEFVYLLIETWIWLSQRQSFSVTLKTGNVLSSFWFLSNFWLYSVSWLSWCRFTHCPECSWVSIVNGNSFSWGWHWSACTPDSSCPLGEQGYFLCIWT